MGQAWNKTESTPVEETPLVPECLEKVRKRYRKKRTKLEEEFPSYLQEAFFGKELLDKSKQSKQSRQASLVTTGFCEENSGAHAGSKPPNASFLDPSSGAHAGSKPPNASFLDPSSDPLLSATSTTTPISKAGGLRMFTSLLLLILDEHFLELSLSLSYTHTHTHRRIHTHRHREVCPQEVSCHVESPKSTL
ncbi:unnamed protein product [Coregonus sp. 'balchen']|nr:unnamed protein product [Coregonus sp. 'balchen']